MQVVFHGAFVVKMMPDIVFFVSVTNKKHNVLVLTLLISIFILLS